MTKLPVRHLESAFATLGNPKNESQSARGGITLRNIGDRYIEACACVAERTMPSLRQAQKILDLIVLTISYKVADLDELAIVTISAFMKIKDPLLFEKVLDGSIKFREVVSFTKSEYLPDAEGHVDALISEILATWQRHLEPAAASPASSFDYNRAQSRRNRVIDIASRLNLW